MREYAAINAYKSMFLAFYRGLHSSHRMIEFFMKRFLLLGLSVLLGIILFTISRNSKGLIGDLKVRGNSYIEDIRILQKKNGITLWTLNAKKADFIEGEGKAKLSDINMVIEKNGIVLYADKGIYDLIGQSFTTYSAVRADSKDFTITADSIACDVSTGTINTNGRVELDSKKFRVEGKGMQTDSDKKVKILDDVKATFNQ
jgi:LPS export ABC transporter protein LptC